MAAERGARIELRSPGAAGRREARLARRHRLDRTLVRAGSVALAIAMVAVTVLLVGGVPVLALYLGSLVSAAPQPGFAGILVVVVALVAGALGCWLLLAKLQALRWRLSDTRVPRVKRGWLQSQSDSGGRPATLLDTVMTWLVLIAVVALVVWYFGFAGSYLPPGL